MNFLCSLLEDTEYYLEVYNTLQKNNPTSEESSEITNWGNGKQNYEENPNPNPKPKPRIPLGLAARLITYPEITSLTEDGSFLPPLDKTYSAQFLLNFSLVLSLKIHQNQTCSILLQKQKLIPRKLNRNISLMARMIKKSKYDSLVKQHYKNEKWIDRSFPQKKQYQKEKIIELRWENLKYIAANTAKANFTFIDGPIQPTDIVQGDVGDCYFLSAIAALAKKPERILRLFPSIKLNEGGVYMAKLMFKGILQEVLVDEYFPIQKLTSGERLLGCYPCRGKNEIYTMILEKCWAKLWGSYEKIDGGLPHEALHALTGALTKNYILSEEASTTQKSEEFFEQVLTFVKNEYVMCVGTSPKSGEESYYISATHHSGKILVQIAPAHIYCVEDVFLSKNSKMVKLYNPWGFNQVKASDKTDVRLIKGEIEVHWEDFVRFFNYLTVCKIRDNAHYLSSQLSFRPQKFKFIDLTVSQVSQGKTSYFALTISETDRKQEIYNNKTYLSVTYVVLQYCQNDRFELITIKTQYLFSDHYLELHNLKNGKYLVAVYISDAQIKEKLTFGVYSEHTFGFIERQVDSSFEENFMSQVLLTYDKTMANQKQTRIYPEPNNKNIWISFNMMINRSQFGYYLLHVGKEEKKTYQLELGSVALKKAGLTLAYPYNGEVVKLVAKPGFETIATFTVKNMENAQRRHFHELRALQQFIDCKPHYQ